MRDLTGAAKTRWCCGAGADGPGGRNLRELLRLCAAGSSSSASTVPDRLPILIYANLSPPP